MTEHKALSFFMAGVVAQSRNTLFPSLIQMAVKLQELGCEYVDGKIVVNEFVKGRKNV